MSTRYQRIMKEFWDGRAREHALFYVATWRGYQCRDTQDFFIDQQEATHFLQAAGYCPTGQDRMLEIGCGVGRMTCGFAPLFGQVHAIDVSGEMLRQARRYLATFPNIYLYETNGIDLHLFRDNTFHFCFSYIVFQHIPLKSIIVTYIHEVGRVLKPGGIFAFQVNGLPDIVPGVSEERMLLLTLQRIIRRLKRRSLTEIRGMLRHMPGRCTSPAWVGAAMNEKEVSTACRDSGLQVTNLTGAGTQFMWITAQKP